MELKFKALSLAGLAAFTFMTATVRAETNQEKSRRIAKAADVLGELAEGFQEFRIKPTSSIKEAMQRLSAKAHSMSAAEFEESWVGESSEAWAADSAAWGSTSMKRALSYVVDFYLNEENFEGAEDPDGELRKLQPKIRAAKAAFRDLLGTGVIFGVAPMGAVQCGVQFAALAIVDPHSGKIYVLWMEGSGC